MKMHLAAATTFTLALIVLNTARGGDTQCGNVGPDVIVGEIPNVSNYSSSGGIEAFAIGTTSCNIGDMELLWISGTNEHPVIAQNMFRLNNGRIEQIGQAWLKHGFFALQGDACGCGCIQSSSGSRLGIGCSDPYSSSLNGGQNGLGPKFEVNPHTGAFPFPATDIDLTGNSIYKRLQVHISDLDPAQDGGGTYFVESQYVTPDDSAWDNQNKQRLVSSDRYQRKRLHLERELQRNARDATRAAGDPRVAGQRPGRRRDRRTGDRRRPCHRCGEGHRSRERLVPLRVRRAEPQRRTGVRLVRRPGRLRRRGHGDRLSRCRLSQR